MTVKQRKGKKTKAVVVDQNNEMKNDSYNAGKDKVVVKGGTNVNNKNNGTKKKKSNIHNNMKFRKKVSFSTMLLVMTGFLTVIGGILYYYYSKYGITILLGHGAKDYKWTPYEWRKFIDDNEKTVLLIGGPHRSGTTILWEAIKRHPDIVGFGDRFETGVDYSEGVLFQEVYPRFGVGLEFKKNFGAPKRAKGEEAEKMDGLGRYALLPDVHWTKENRRELLQDSSTLSKLLNRFAPYWDKSKKFGTDGLKKAKVWVEKSPQNGVLSTFLEGVYNMPVQEDGSVAEDIENEPKRLATKFMFMTRHPIANVYATDKFVKESMGGYIDFEILLRNYIQLHKYMRMDEKVLDSPSMWARLEDFATDPKNVLKEIFSFLDVSNDEKVINDILSDIGSVQSNPNGKYFKKWCEEGIQEHGQIMSKYAEDLMNLNLDYDLEICKTQ
jgi:hypothetical protein